MGKTKHKFSNFRYEEKKYYDGEEYSLSQIKEDRKKKKLKRLQTAIKTKNIDRLLDYDEDYDY